MNTFRYIILWAAVAVAAIVQADTLQQRVDALDAAPNVLEAWIEVAPVSIGRAGTVYAGRVAWVESTGATATQKGIEVIVVNLGVVGQEAAYWLNAIPEPLKPIEETKYLSGRNTGGWAALTGAQQLAAITTKLNEYWVHAQGAARDPILHLVIEPINANTIKATGEFDTSTGWEQRTYYVTLTDPNGSLVAGNSNVKFRRLAETVQAP